MEKVSTLFWCKKKGQQVDVPICISRQNKKICQCEQGKAVVEAKPIRRTRTQK